MTQSSALPPTPLLEGWLTSAEAATRAGVTQHHIAHLCRTKQLNARKIAPRVWLVEEKSLDLYLATEHKRGAKPKP